MLFWMHTTTMIEMNTATFNKRNFALFLVYQFFAHLEFFNGLFVVYLSERKIGMDFINVLLFVTTITRVLAELPSGYLSDRLGDKRLLCVATVAMILFSAGMMSSTSHLFLVMLFVVHGLSIAGTTGADDGFLYRTVLQGNDAALERVRPVSASLNYFALGVAALAGGALGQHLGWPAVFGAFCVSGVLALVALASIQAPSIVPRETATEATSFSNMRLFIRSNLPVFGFIALFALLEACANVVFIYAQFKSHSLSLNLAIVGIAMAGIELASAGGAFLSRWVKIEGVSLYFCLVGTILSLLIGFSDVPALFLGSFLAVILFVTLLKILCETFLITVVPSTVIATALSLFSFLISIFTGALHLLFAILGASLSQNGMLSILLGLATLSSILIALSISRFRELND